MDIRVKRMKSMMPLMVVFIALVTIASCNKKKETNNSFTQTVNVEAEGWQNKEVRVSNLTTAIEGIEQGDTWVTATKMSYTSGSPSIRLDVQANTGTQERQTNIITGTDEKRVILTVKQVKPGDTPDENHESEHVDYGIDDPHDTQSDQPAYSRQQR